VSVDTQQVLLTTYLMSRYQRANFEDAISFTASYYLGGVPTGYSWNASGTIEESSGHLVLGTGTSGVSECIAFSGEAKRYTNLYGQ